MKKSAYHKSITFFRQNIFINFLCVLITIIAIEGCSKSGNNPTPTPEPTKPIVVAATPKTANFDKLIGFNTFKASQSTPYNLLMIGDSYVQGNFFSWQLRAKLLGDGYLDGGPGYCSFGRWSATELNSIDSSIDPTELTFTYDPTKWTSESINTYGPCDYVSNITPNATINVKSTVSLSTMTILYERHTSSGDFRYRVNGGNWTTISAINAKQDVNSVVVDVSSAGSSINLDIEPLKAGEVFFGVLGKRAGNVLTLDKVGSSGATAEFFAHNELWKESIKMLSPNGVIIIFGTNEMVANVTPAQFKINVQNIITQVKDVAPTCDIMIMCPPQTMYETEDPRTYKIAAYADVLYKLAQENNAAFINLPLVFGPFSQASVTNDLMDPDRKHPGEKGGELIANTVFAAFKK
jgi:lysophospholipase L1-like esterase